MFQMLLNKYMKGIHIKLPLFEILVCVCSNSNDNDYFEFLPQAFYIK